MDTGNHGVAVLQPVTLDLQTGFSYPDKQLIHLNQLICFAHTLPLLSCSLPWSQGQTEGQIDRLKCVKRQMYGRAQFDLLQLRFLWPVDRFSTKRTEPLALQHATLCQSKVFRDAIRSARIKCSC
jgi:hypothetical protein